mgnify:CR=1 FL=1
MWKFLNDILCEFRICFTRKASYEWFVVSVISFMMGSDCTGVTSVIRKLVLNPKHDESILHFFHSSAWDIHILWNKWGRIVKKHAPLIQVEGYTVLAGDGIKQPKEAKKMPGVKRHHQESENVSKSEYIFGHLFGVIGALAEKSGKMFCIPLGASIQNGVNKIREWNQEQTAGLSHVEQVVYMAGQCLAAMGKSMIVLDRLFLSVSALQICLQHVTPAGEWMLHMVTKAKRSVVAYTDPTAKAGKGRPRKKGESIKLWDLFASCSAAFEQVEVKIYGKTMTVGTMTRTLLWGPKLYQRLLFVWVVMDGKKTILVSTHLGLSAIQVIELYGWRFKIEVQFKELRHTIGGFAYRFWSKCMPKLNRFHPTKPDILEQIQDPQEKQTMTKTLKAIEGYVMLACIALGIVQIMTLNYGMQIKMSSFLFLRTQTSDIPSELTMTRFLDKNIFRVIEKHRHFGIYQIIRNKQEDCHSIDDLDISKINDDFSNTA